MDRGQRQSSSPSTESFGKHLGPLGKYKYQVSSFSYKVSSIKYEVQYFESSKLNQSSLVKLVTQCWIKHSIHCTILILKFKGETVILQKCAKDAANAQYCRFFCDSWCNSWDLFQLCQFNCDNMASILVYIAVIRHGSWWNAGIFCRLRKLSLSYLAREKMCAIHKLLQYFIISSVLCL